MTPDHVAKLVRGGTVPCECRPLNKLTGYRRAKPKPGCGVCSGTGNVEGCQACGAGGYSHETRGECPRCQGKGYVRSLRKDKEE